jgi:DNA-binding response OmpR family regulator
MTKKILIIDDEPDITYTIKNILEDNGFAADTFNDPILALNNYKVNFYDLVILDIKMPKINGFELYRRIKESNPHMKIVFITAFEINKEEFSKVIPSLDVIDFISKPVSMSTLMTKLNSILNQIN